LLDLGPGLFESEALWRGASSLAGVPWRNRQSIDLSRIEPVLSALENGPPIPDAGGRPIPFALLRAEVERLRSFGETVIQAPVARTAVPAANHPTFAPVEASNSGGIDRIKTVYESVMGVYPNVVGRWFPKFARSMPHALMLPARLIAVIHVQQNVGGWSSWLLSWRFEPLPLGQTSSANVSFAERPAGIVAAEDADSRHTVTLFRELRPRASQRVQISVGGHSTADFLFANDAATELVYEWLQGDLKAMGWAE
jgi:hypothetical protein